MPLSQVEHMLFDGINDKLEVTHFRVEDQSLLLSVHDRDTPEEKLCTKFNKVDFQSMNVLSRNEKAYKIPWQLNSFGAQFIGNHKWRFNLRCKNVEFVFEARWPAAIAASRL